MKVYFIADEVTISSREFGDVANLESFERELDDLYPEGWSYDYADLDIQDNCNASEIDLY